MVPVLSWVVAVHTLVLHGSQWLIFLWVVEFPVDLVVADADLLAGM